MVQFISSLRCRLIVLVLLAVIPAFGVILHSASSHRDLTAEQVEKNALRAARAIAAEHERVFENAHQFLIMLARLPQIRENDKASCRKILAGLLEPLYADLGVTDLKGNSICTALPAASSLLNAKGKHQARVIETHVSRRHYSNRCLDRQDTFGNRLSDNGLARGRARRRHRSYELFLGDPLGRLNGSVSWGSLHAD